MKKRNAKKSSLKWIILPVLALLVFLFTRIAGHFNAFIENWYSQKIYVVIAQTISGISALIPLSLDDLFYFILITTILIIIVLPIFRKTSFKKSLKSIINILAGIYMLFYVLWGFNYFRNDLNNRLDIEKQDTNTELFTNELKKQIKTTNETHYTFTNFDKNKIDSLIEESYKKLAPVLNLKYPQGKRQPKSITLSSFFAKAGISGYFGPFFNEVHINKFVLPVEYPFVLAHEKAHQLGITSEAEANFYAWLVCRNSSSEQLQYSANLIVLRFFLYQGYELEDYKEIVNELNDNVKADYQKIRENWQKHRNEKVDRIASKVNDTYLKSNRVKKGIDDYNDVVQLVMDFTYDESFQAKYKSLLY
ncbi:MAG: DUF3810 domain-containing protein [Prolixibacteraceae bacterium]|nr:DUF3810 domain-containing protein [Prolixibacteraceae bacterium]